MDFKKSKAPVNTVTRNIMDLCDDTHNIYESVAIIAKRANQISIEIKQELSKKLQEFASYNDSLEEVFENREQIEISRYYEKLPKPTLLDNIRSLIVIWVVISEPLTQMDEKAVPTTSLGESCGSTLIGQEMARTGSSQHMQRSNSGA